MTKIELEYFRRLLGLFVGMSAYCGASAVINGDWLVMAISVIAIAFSGGMFVEVSQRISRTKD